jgi:hypothetical protein
MEGCRSSDLAVNWDRLGKNDWSEMWVFGPLRARGMEARDIAFFV